MDIRDGLLLLDDKSVDMTITSPPYWGLRDYGDETISIWDGDRNCEHEWNEQKLHKSGGMKGGRANYHRSQDIDINQGFCSKCGAWRGQLGLETHPDLYVKHLCDIYDRVRRVLKDEGTAWINIGDTYSGSGKGAGYDGSKESWRFDKKPSLCEVTPAKSLSMIPFRFALEMVSRGWILRNTIIWHKPNAMPSSVKDRFTVDFEYLFFFSKKRKYYFEQQFEESILPKGAKKDLATEKTFGGKSVPTEQKANRPGRIWIGDGTRNMRTTWSISTKPFSEAHFAIFPEELIEIPIKACCPEKGIVLDPFIGAGTTAVVAKKLNRKYIGFEINPKYVEIADKRLL